MLTKWEKDRVTIIRQKLIDESGGGEGCEAQMHDSGFSSKFIISLFLK
jgi:hypothetical protein